MKSISLIFLLCFCFYFGNSQNVLPRPVKYIKPINPGLPNDKDKIPTNKDDIEPWIVFSDHEGNVVYNDPNLSVESGAKLKFMEPLCVTKKMDTILQIAYYSDTKESKGGKREMKFGTKPIGYIHAGKLLLSKVCLKHEEKFNRKAMVINTFDLKNDKGKSINELKNKPMYYDGPDCIIIRDSVGLYKICHVYKESKSDSSVLLGDGWTIPNVNRPEMNGWVPIKKITPWNHKIAWEYNWHPEAIEMRKWSYQDKDNVEQIRGDIIWKKPVDALLKGTFEGASGDYCVIENPIYEKRKPTTFYRYPVLEESIDNSGRVAKVGSIGAVVDKNGNPIPESIVIELDLLITKIIKNKQSINVLFVVDATESMERFSGSITNAIKEITETLLGNTQNNYCFGAAIYRDEKEKEKKGKEKKYLYQSINPHQFSSDTGRLNSFLRTEMDPDFNKYDGDQPEAVFYGITEAVDEYNFNPSQTNYLLLLGDAGDHENYDPVNEPKTTSNVDISEVINALSEKKINLLAYQIKYETDFYDPNDTTWFKKYQTQIKDIIKSVAGKIDGGQNDIELVEEITSTAKKYSLNNSPRYIGQLNARHKGDSLSPQLLKEEIIDALFYIENNTNKEIDRIGSGELNNVNIESGTLSQIATLLAQLQKLYPSLSQKDRMDILKGSRQFYQEGYTTLKPLNSEISYYQPVILMEQTQFNFLRNEIGYLKDIDLTINEYRDQLINVFGRLIPIIVGEMTEIERQNYPICEVIYQLTGCHCPDKWLEDGELTIISISTVPDSIIVDMQMEFNKSYNYLTNIADARESYNGRIPRKNSRFSWYWIPSDLFPHNPKRDDVSKNDSLTNTPLYLK